MLFFDMDGVIAKYDRDGYNFKAEDGPNFLKSGYFFEREPDPVGLDLFKECLKYCPNDTYIITGIPNIISIRQ